MGDDYKAREAELYAELCKDVTEAVATWMGPPGQAATLILPADVSWSEGGVVEPPKALTPPPCAAAVPAC